MTHITPSSSAGYIPGLNWVMCDICGFRMRSNIARVQTHGPHKGLLVCPEDYDKKNPQWDEIEAVEEKIIPGIVNVEPDSESVNVAYTDDLLTLADEESMFLLADGDSGLLLSSSSDDESSTWVTGDDL